MFALNDQVAIVTGGAKGIGKGIAAVLAKAGAQVVIVDIDAEAGKQTAEALGATFESLDVTDRDACQHVGEPEDIGHAACFLASPEARFITGQTLIVDGGQILPESFEAIL